MSLAYLNRILPIQAACKSIITGYGSKSSVTSNQTRSLFHWINLQFNVVDQARREQIGADRSCAEWVLRNGGAVKFKECKDVISDYNKLPLLHENEQQEKGGVANQTHMILQEINATKASIMENGFDHLMGCRNISRIVLNQCNYLDDKALAKFSYVQNSLRDLEILSCYNITDAGLLHLKVLFKLMNLTLKDLPQIKNIQQVTEELQKSLPK